MSERVLVFGDDAKAFLAVVRSLGRRGLEVHAAPTDLAAPALKSRYIAASHALPSYWHGAGQWAGAVAGLADRLGIGLIVPTSDASLLMLLRHADRIGRQRLALPGAAAAAIFTDKAETRRSAFEHGVPVCPGRLLAPGDEPDALIEAFGLPLVLKPRRSWDPAFAEGKRPAWIVRNRAALEQALGGGLAGGWVVESYFRGVGVGLSVLARQGEIVAAIQHRRLQEENETGPSTRRVTEPVSPRLLAWTRELVRVTRLDGVAMFEYRWDPARDRHVLLEVNARFWGSLALALAAGVDFPARLYDLHRSLAPEAARAYPAGLVRSDLSGEYCRLVGRIDEARGRAGRLRASAAALAQLPRLLRPAAFDSWAEDDPEPFFAERNAVIRRIRTAAVRRLSGPALLHAFRARRGLRRAIRGGEQPVRLLVVGNANTCRSPFAELLLRERVAEADDAVEIRSAGTLQLEDRAPAADALAAAAQFGVDLSGHRSRSVTPGALLSASAVIVFDHATADRLRSIEPDFAAPVLRLPDLTDARDIADPGGAGSVLLAGEFRRISESVAALAGELLHSLQIF